MKLREASLVSLIVAALSLVAHRLFGWPAATDWIAEWIMAHTPNTASVWILGTFGDWAKPLATTGGLAAIGFAVWLAMQALRAPAFLPSRRSFLTETLMAGGVVAVAGESYLRERAFAARATPEVDLFPHAPPADTFAPSLVRKNVTPAGQFYVMSKNTVDPVLDPGRRDVLPHQ